MNRNRRKQLVKALGQAEELKDTIETLRNEEQECFDNLPESLQYSERGDTMQEIANSLDYAVSNLEEAIDNLNEALER
ncbi:MAG: hypothetical protein IKH15_09315 [Bacteroidales bacterium]|nr:hypothetical protein [Bacteroidales bacterium]